MRLYVLVAAGMALGCGGSDFTAAAPRPDGEACPCAPSEATGRTESSKPKYIPPFDFPENPPPRPCAAVPSAVPSASASKPAGNFKDIF